MRYPFVIVLLLSILAVQSQQTKVVDVNKEDVQVVGSNFYVVGDVPVASTKYVKVVEGIPYFTESWMKAKLVLETGRVYENIPVRLDFIENTLQYISPDGKELIATTPVRIVTLWDSVSGKEYRFIHSSFLGLPENMEAGWYQQLTVGTATLYKKIRKIIAENKPYGSATVEQTINTSHQYFVDAGSVFTRIKKIKELPGLLKDKKDELNKYISSRKLSGKTDEDYTDLVTYYNNLVAKKIAWRASDIHYKDDVSP